MAFLWLLSDQSTLGPASFLGRIPNGDKIAHAVAFGVLAALCFRPMAHRAVPVLSRAPVLFAVAVALGYGLIDELHQARVPGRDPSVWDLSADLVGAALAGLVLILWTDRPRGPSRAADIVRRRSVARARPLAKRVVARRSPSR